MLELKRIRERQGLSRAGLAAKSGVYPATVNRIEAGERSPTVATLEKLAGALEVEMMELFPKAQGELWDSIGVAWRPEHDFEAVRQGVEQLLIPWERWLSVRDEAPLGREAQGELARALASLVPTLYVAVDAEVEELVHSTGQLPGGELKNRTKTGPLYDRLLNLAREAEKILAPEPDVQAADPSDLKAAEK